MHGEWEGGKGSTFRKIKDPKTFYTNWDNIFQQSGEKGDTIYDTRLPKKTSSD